MYLIDCQHRINRDDWICRYWIDKHGDKRCGAMQMF